MRLGPLKSGNGLVDEIRLWVFPVMVGVGKRLFEQSSGLDRLTLVKSERTPNGVVMCLYRCDGSTVS